MSHTLTDRLFANPPADTSTVDRFVLLVLANYANGDGESCYPSLERIAGIVGCNVRTVRSRLLHLQTIGLVTVDTTKRRHAYRLTLRENGAIPDRGSAIEDEIPDQGSALIPDRGSAEDPDDSPYRIVDPVNSGSTIRRSSQLIRSDVIQKNDDVRAEDQVVASSSVSEPAWLAPYRLYKQPEPVPADVTRIEQALAFIGRELTEDEWTRCFEESLVPGVANSPFVWMLGVLRNRKGPPPMQAPKPPPRTMQPVEDQFAPKTRKQLRPEQRPTTLPFLPGERRIQRSA